MLSLVCDYRVMTDGSKRNAWLSMNEVMRFPPSLSAAITKFRVVALSRSTLALTGRCPLLLSYALKLEITASTAKLRSKDTASPLRKLCRPESWTLLSRAGPLKL